MSDNLFHRFSHPKTKQGSFRSFAHGWVGAPGIAEAARLLQTPGRVVSLHICGHHVHGDDTTYSVLRVANEKSYVQGRSRELRTVGEGSYAICGIDPVEIASHLAAELYSRCDRNQCVFRQPTCEEMNEMGLE